MGRQKTNSDNTFLPLSTFLILVALLGLLTACLQDEEFSAPIDDPSPTEPPVQEIPDFVIQNVPGLISTFSGDDPANQTKIIQIDDDLSTINITDISASSTADWLNLDLDGTETPTTLTISLDIADLSPGEYQTDVTVSSTNSGVASKTFTIQIAIQGVELLLSPNTITITTHKDDFTQNKQGSLELTSNTNGVIIDGLQIGDIQYSTGASNWLIFNPFNTGTPSTVSFSVDEENIVPGIYSAEVLFQSTTYPDAKQTLEVILIIPTPDQLISGEDGKIWDMVYDCPWNVSNPELCQAEGEEVDFHSYLQIENDGIGRGVTVRDNDECNGFACISFGEDGWWIDDNETFWVQMKSCGQDTLFEYGLRFSTPYNEYNSGQDGMTLTYVSETGDIREKHYVTRQVECPF